MGGSPGPASLRARGGPGCPVGAGAVIARFLVRPDGKTGGVGGGRDRHEVTLGSAPYPWRRPEISRGPAGVFRPCLRFLRLVAARIGLRPSPGRSGPAVLALPHPVLSPFHRLPRPS